MRSIWMRAGLAAALLGSVSCGPYIAEFTGRYDVGASELISQCDRAAPLQTVFSDLTSVQIREGTDWDLFVSLGECQLKANILEETRFTVQTQSCPASLDDATAEIRVTGEGSVVDDQLSLSLSGTFTGTDAYGLPYTCTYTLELSPMG